MKTSTFALSTLTFCLGLSFSAHADTAINRSAWVVDKLYNYNHPFAAQRPDELTTKMQKMQASPFIFYRGTAHLFYEDMKTWTPTAYTNFASRSTWLSGDMHMANMGAFKDASGNTVFDTTDFDEGYWGNYAWDVRRMAVSIVLAAKENGLSAANQQQLVIDFVDAYLNKMVDFQGANDELNYRLISSNTSGVVQDLIKKSASQTRAQLLSKNTTTSSGARKFLVNSELVKLSVSDYAAIETAVANYVYTIAPSKRYASSFYVVKDIRLKLGSGVGSLGRHRYYVLIQGATSSAADDIILQVKQQSPSTVSIAAQGALPAWSYENHEGQRAARSMKAALSNTDVLTGWTSVNGAPYLVREKSPFEADTDTTLLNSYSKFSTAVQFMGKVLAKNHAMADKDYDATLISYSMDKEINDAVISKSGFKTETANFAMQYAQQVQLDWTAMVSAAKANAKLY